MLENVTSRETLPSLLTVRHVAHQLNISEQQVWRLIKAGQLAVLRISRSVRVAQQSVDNLRWQSLFTAVGDPALKRSCGRFARWCSASGVVPSQVSQQHAEAFATELVELLPARRARQAFVGLCRVWNRTAMVRQSGVHHRSVAGWRNAGATLHAGTRLSRPPSGLLNRASMDSKSTTKSRLISSIGRTVQFLRWIRFWRVIRPVRLLRKVCHFASWRKQNQGLRVP